MSERKEQWPPICPDCGQAMFALAGREYHCLQQQTRIEKEKTSKLPMSDKVTPQRVCPQCGKPLKKVVQSENSLWMNEMQYQYGRAGDYYCESCPSNDRGKQNLCYWWEAGCPAPPISQQSAPVPEVEIVGWIMTWELRTNEWASTIGEDKWEPIVRFSKDQISELCRNELLSNKRVRSLSDPIPLVRRSDMETALAAKEREIEEAKELVLHERKVRVIGANKDRAEIAALTAENEKLRGVVEAAQSEEIREALTVGITELTTWLAEGCDCPAEGHICGRHRLDVSINKLRAALSKGESHE